MDGLSHIRAFRFSPRPRLTGYDGYYNSHEHKDLSTRPFQCLELGEMSQGEGVSNNTNLSQIFRRKLSLPAWAEISRELLG